MANNFEPKSKSVVDWLSERANRHNSRLTELEIARLGKVWIDPGILAGIYTWQNGFDSAGDPYYPFQYRLYDRDHLQVNGTISDSGPSGSLGFTLLPPFWPTKDQAVWGNVDVSGEVQLCVIRIVSSNGQCFINY